MVMNSDHFYILGIVDNFRMSIISWVAKSIQPNLYRFNKTNNEIAIATIIVSGIRTRRRDTFFCAAFRKYPKKRRLDCRFFLRSCRRAASMPRPFGLFPTKPAVLSAANESKTSLLRNISDPFPRKRGKVL